MDKFKEKINLLKQEVESAHTRTQIGEQNLSGFRQQIAAKGSTYSYYIHSNSNRC